jgi:hypothetical protein
MHKPAIAFFGFNRPDCTQVVFEEIRRHRPEKLLLVADGPRIHVPTDAPRCEAVRQIMKSVDWQCDVRMDFSDSNLGCKRRMASGIDWVFSQVDEAVLLEDDCVPSADFFRFCSEMLARYRDNPKVMHIGGSNFQAGRVRGDGSYYFSRFFHVWGWASWRRAWKNYDVAMLSWPQAKSDNWISKYFSSPAQRQYWTGVFDSVHGGKLDTWDYQWVYAGWQHDGVSVIPNVNLITNIGFGPDATHTIGPAASLKVPTGVLGELRHPKTISVNQAADRFTFDENCGGNQMTQARNAVPRVRRQMSALKKKLATAFSRPS